MSSARRFGRSVLMPLSTFCFVTLFALSNACLADPASQPAVQPTSQPDTRPAPAVRLHGPPPENFVRAQRAQRDASRDTYNKLRDGGPIHAESLLRFHMEKGVVHAETANLPSGVQLRMNVEGSKAIWIFYRTPVNGAANLGPAGGISNTNITRVDPDAKRDEDVWSVLTNLMGDNVWIIGMSVTGRVMYSQGGGQVTMNVLRWTSGPGGNNIQTETTVNAHAGSISQLRSEHPDEFRKYLLPLLGVLCDTKWLTPGLVTSTPPSCMCRRMSRCRHACRRFFPTLMPRRIQCETPPAPNCWSWASRACWQRFG